MNLKTKRITSVLILTTAAALFFCISNFSKKENPSLEYFNKLRQLSLKDWIGDDFTNHYFIFIDQNGLKGRAEATVSNSMVYYYGENNLLKWSFDGEAFFRNDTNLIFRGIREFFYATNNLVMGGRITNGIVVVYGKTYLVLDPAAGHLSFLGAD